MESNDYSLNFPYGFVYLIKGSSDKLFWLLKDSPHFEFFPNSSISELSSLLTDTPLSTRTYFTLFSSTLRLHSLLSPSRFVRLFILFPSYDGELESKASSVYKLSFPDYFVKVSLHTLNTFSSPLIKPQLDFLKSSDLEVYNLLLDNYKDHPFSLYRLLSSDFLPSYLYEPSLSLYNLLLAISNKDHVQFISHLSQLESLSAATFYELFILDTDSYPVNAFGRLLTYATNNFGLYCPTLWYYFKMLLTLIKDYPFFVQLLFVKAFFMWLYYSTTTFAKLDRPGLSLYYYKKINKYNLNFYPSKVADKNFIKLLDDAYSIV